jgi:Fe-S cluster assembly scaffold protein SufB
MDLNFQHTNVLPARTWNRLGINDTALAEELPPAAPYTGPGPAGELPEGVAAFSGPLPAGEPETGMGHEEADFVAEHRNCGVSLKVAAGVHAKTPVFLTYRVDENSPFVVDENAVVAEEGSDVTVVVSYLGGARRGFHAGLTRLYAAKGASVRLIQVQLLGDGCLGMDNIGAAAGEGGTIHVIQAELGGRKALAGCKARLEGLRSRLSLDAIYFGDRSRSIDINYVAQHVGRKTRSDIRVSGALLDESEKTFRGTIGFVRGAKQAVGKESEFNLLFSPKVRNRTAPLILCAEEDVDGQHAASTGKIDENRLFYLMTRGLSELEAKKLIIKAQFRPVTDQIPDEKLRNDVAEYVEKRLNRL